MNGLLIVATLFAGGYCWVLARRVQDLKSLDKGLGGSIVALTRQIELARTTLDEARAASKGSHEELAQLVGKADAAAGQLRMLIAAAPIPATPAAAPVAPVPAPAAITLPAPVATAPEAAAPEPEAAPARRTRSRAATRETASEPPLSAEQTPVAEVEERTTVVVVPKPRTLLPIENPLRRFRTDATLPAQSNEEDLLAALRALAGTEH